MKLRYFLIFLPLLTACAATPITPAGAKARIVTSEPRGCDYLGEVTGNQGDALTGGFTSNSNLETGARNDMKNQAAKLGGNTIQPLANRAGETSSFNRYGGSGNQTNVTYVGAVYKCPAANQARVRNQKKHEQDSQELDL
jgi:hypothetical protein